MKLLLQKPIPGGHVIEQIIAKVCGPYCHTEILFEDGRAFSSSAYDKGVRFVTPESIAKSLEANEEYWTVIPLPWIETPQILEWCEGEVGAGYDFRGAFASGFGMAHQDEFKWFCSEICAEIISRASGYNIPKLLNPTALGEWVEMLLSNSGKATELAQGRANKLSVIMRLESPIAFTNKEELFIESLLT
jgi:hypothetical protein